MERKGYLFMLAAAFCFSWQTIFTKKLLAEGMNSLDVVTGIFVVGAIVINGWVVLCRKKQIYLEAKQNLRPLLILGTFCLGVSVCLFYALNFINAGIASMLLYTNPVFVCLYFLITGTRPVSRSNKIALVLAILGSGLALNLFSGEGGISFVGILLGMGAGLFYAAYDLYYDLRLRTVNSWTVLVGTTTVSAVIGLAINPKILVSFPQLPLMGLLIIALSAVLTRLIPVFFMYEGIRRIGAEKASVMATLELPITLIIAFLFLGETLTWIQFVGVSVIVVATGVLQKEK
ncbi:MAG: EamA family transporter [Anaerovoracaceae bacterium]